MRHLAFFFSLVIIVFTTYSTPSFANDVEAFLKQVEAIAKKNNGSFTYTLETSNEEGDAVIKDLKLSERNDKNTVTIDELLISKGKKIGENGFSFEGLVANSVLVNINESKRESVDVQIESINFSQVTYPDLSDRQHPLWPINIEAAAIQNISADITNEDVNVKFNVPSISLADLKHTGGQAFSLASFNLSPFNGDVSGEDNASGTFSFDGLTLTDSEYLGEFTGQIGSLNLGALVAAGVTPDKQTVQVDFAGITAENIYLPGSDESRPFISPKPTSMNLGALKVALGGSTVMGWDGGNAIYSLNPTTNIVDTEGSWENMFVDFSKFPLKPQDKAGIQPLFDLGYEKLSMNMDYIGTWDIGTGLFDISKFGFDVVDAFAFDLNMNVSGYTVALARQINKLSNQMQLTDDPKQQEAIGLQILALMSGLSINEMSIEVEDRSLLNKVIDYQAAKQNQDPNQIRGIAGPMVGILLAPFQVPEFASNFSAALTTFMQGNKSIKLALKPSPSVNGAEIAALVAGVNAGNIAPAEILQRFNVTVNAE